MSKRRLPNTDTNENNSKKKCITPDATSDDDDSVNLTQDGDFMPEREGEVGIIEKVSLKNFMCHSRLDVTFGPHVNFIIGRNGSGKSAVVAAVVVGLGGKAAATNRGSTIKGFIKSGKSCGEVQIKLRNKGQDSYKHDLYGDSIIVKRKFNNDGISKYQLLSKNGTVVSEKREELSHILDQFNIQVDNPMSILNQETSRNFLNSKSPHDKYKFFLKATQLDTMKHDQNTTTEQKEITKDIIFQKEKTLPLLEKEVLEWEQKFKSLDAIDEMKQKVQNLKNEMAWSFVSAKERGLEPIKDKLNHEESRLPRFTRKVDEVKSNLERHQKKHKEIQQQIVKISEEVQALDPQRHQTKTIFQKAKDTSRQTHNNLSKIEKEKRNTVRDRHLVNERIVDLRTTAQVDYEAERRARQEKIDQLTANLEALSAQQKTTEHQKNQFLSAVTKYTNDGYSLSHDEQVISQNIDSNKQHLRTLTAARGDRLQRFGQNIPSIVKRIDEYHNQGRFHRRPLGPLGSCFQLRDPIWALAIECCLKGLLHSFCCTDHHDEKVLESIFDREMRHGKHPSIIVSQFLDKIHDVSRFRVRSEHLCILDSLEIEDPVVANTLIDQRSVENIILIADNREARRVMQHNAPTNCKQAYTAVGDEMYCHPTFRYYSSNSDQARFLAPNVLEEIRHCENVNTELQNESAAMKRQIRLLNEDVGVNKREEHKCDTQLMKVAEAMQKIHFEIQELKSIEDPAPIDIATLEEEVVQFDIQISVLSERREAALSAHQENLQALKEADKAYREVETQLKSLTENADPLKEEDALALNEIELSKTHKKHYDGKLKDHEKLIGEFRRRKERYEEDLESDVKKASKICEKRMRTRRSPESLEIEVKELIKRISTEEESRGNMDEITLKYYETQEAFKRIRKEVQQLKNFIENLERILSIRESHYKTFLRMISVRARSFFVILLSNRNYTGKMSFNHNSENLEITVQPLSDVEEAAKDLKSLSGGERSFSTVCFILALWEAMEAPFRCLDEFDVFMDMVNRRISMDMMMEVARIQTNCQFIFLTPQDMSQLNIGVDSRIFRMPDPDRGQGVLTFGEDETVEQ